MNISTKLAFTFPMVATLAACGGGGETGTADGDVPPLSEATSVQLIEQSGISGVRVTDNADKPDTSASALTYVFENNGTIYGVPADSIPRGVTFFAEGTASANVAINEINYVLVNGDVTAAINEDTGELYVGLGSFEHVTGETGTQSMSGDAELTTAARSDTIELSMETSLSGSGDCNGVNLFCGGSLTIRDRDTENFRQSESNTVEYTYTMSTGDFVAGVYGADRSDIELGGVVNFDNGDDEARASAFATFVSGLE